MTCGHTNTVTAAVRGTWLCRDCGLTLNEDFTDVNKPRDDLPLMVTENGVPLKDQADGLRRFKEACAMPGTRREQFFPGTGRMFSGHHRMAVTKEWLAGWDACLAEIDKRGGFADSGDEKHGPASGGHRFVATARCICGKEWPCAAAFKSDAEAKHG